MVSDSELVERLRQFLSTSDLTTTTTAAVRRQLEHDFDVDLTDKKAFIREQVDLYVKSHFQNDAEADGGGEAAEDGGEAAEDGGEAAEDGGKENEDEDDDDEEDEDEEEEDVKKSAKKKSGKKNDGTKKRGGGFTKPCSLSPLLQKFTGEAELPRTEVVKKMWSYIRENNLQDPSNKRIIKCDDTLFELFGVDKIDMFQMNKALTKHIWPLDSDGSSSGVSSVTASGSVSTVTTSGSVSTVTASVKEKSSAPKKKRGKQEDDDDSDELKGKRQNSGILAPLRLSEALMKFLGTEENELPRSDVIKRMWSYIKQNNLQDPSDKRKIICDDKLKELFDVDTFLGFGVSKLLTAHLFKIER